MTHLDKVFNSHDFEWFGSGGGFDSYLHTLENGDYIVITSSENECMIPTELDEACEIGLYDKHHDNLAYWEAESVSHALHIAKWEVIEYYS